MLGKQVEEFREFVENNTVEVFSAIYRVEHIVSQYKNPNEMPRYAIRQIARELIIEGMPKYLPSVLIDTVIPPEEPSIDFELLSSVLTNIAQKNQSKIEGMYEVLDCMRADNVWEFKQLDNSIFTSEQIAKNCKFFEAKKVADSYKKMSAAEEVEIKLIESQPILLLEAPAPVKKPKRPKKGSHGHNTDYLNFDPTVESFTSDNMEKAGADATVSQPIKGFLPEISDFESAGTSGVTTSDAAQQLENPQNGGYNFAKIFLYATAAVGVGYLAYKVRGAIIENVKEFAAESAKEMALYALVGKEVDSKIGGRQ